MQILLVDTPARRKLFPLTLTRATCDLRMGITTLRQKWERLFKQRSAVLAESYLQHLYSAVEPGEYLVINANLLPNANTVSRLNQLDFGQALANEDGFIAGLIRLQQVPAYADNLLPLFASVAQWPDAPQVDELCKLFQWNERMLADDFEHLTYKRLSHHNTEMAHITNISNVFIEEGAVLEYCHINAADGPVYIGKNAKVMQGSLIRGPFALCEGAVLKMGAKIYGGTTVGPHSIAGGEIKNSLLMGYSNKAHDGYLGDSVIGEWCNLGAGTSNSNLKNNAGEVKMWSYYEHAYVPAGIKCGVVMGDYSRSSINTSFNTGTVVGVCCNVFGEGLTPKFIPDFTWGSKGLSRYEFDKGLKDVMAWMQLKNIAIEEGRIKVLKHIFDHYNH